MPITLDGTAGITSPPVTATKFAPTGNVTEGNGLYLPTTNTLAFGTNGSERMRIDSSGNVGIGTSSPADRFEVKTTGVNGAIETAASLYYPAPYGGGSSGSRLVFKGDNSSGTKINYAGVWMTINSNAIGAENANLIFGTANNGTLTERMRINSGGNVGIGTAGILDTSSSNAPTNIFQVNGGSSTGNIVAGLFTQSDTSGSASSVSINLGMYKTGGSTLLVSVPVIKLIKDRQWTGTTADNDGSVAFSAVRDESSFEAMRIDSSGRLLVGTSTAPTGALSQYSRFSVYLNNAATSAGGQINLVGGARALLNTGNQLGQIIFTDLTDGEYGIIRCEVDAVQGSSDFPGRLVFATTADGAATPTERMRITSAGRLLVGTTTENTSGGVVQVSNGITFPATQSASSDANTLDDYEEGTWTPVLEGSTANPSSVTYSNRNGGSYTKIGDRVIIQAILHTTAYTGGSGTLVVSGLPFSSSPASGKIYPSGTVSLDYLDTPAGVIGSVCTIDSISTPTKLNIAHNFDNSAAAYANLSSLASSGIRFLNFNITYTV